GRSDGSLPGVVARLAVAVVAAGGQQQAGGGQGGDADDVFHVRIPVSVTRGGPEFIASENGKRRPPVTGGLHGTSVVYRASPVIFFSHGVSANMMMPATTPHHMTDMNFSDMEAGSAAPTSPPKRPAIRLPSDTPMNQVPIIMPTKRRGASLVMLDRPIGLRHSSAVVCGRYVSSSQRGATVWSMASFAAKAITPKPRPICTRPSANLPGADGSRLRFASHTHSQANIGDSTM